MFLSQLSHAELQVTSAKSFMSASTHLSCHHIIPNGFSYHHHQMYHHHHQHTINNTHVTYHFSQHTPPHEA